MHCISLLKNAQETFRMILGCFWKISKFLLVKATPCTVICVAQKDPPKYLNFFCISYKNEYSFAEIVHFANVSIKKEFKGNLHVLILFFFGFFLHCILWGGLLHDTPTIAGPP